MPGIAINKEELVQDIENTYQKLRGEFDDIPVSMIRSRTMEGQVKDTQMSIHNLLSYLVGWAKLILKWDKVYITENKIPDLPDTGYTMNDWGKLAERFYREYENEDYNKLLEKFDILVADILDMLRQKDNSEVYGVDWYTTKSSSKGYTFGRMLALNTSSPYKNARARIRKWKKQNL